MILYLNRLIANLNKTSFIRYLEPFQFSKYNNLEMQIQQKTGNFIQKLQKLLKSQTYEDIISWDSTKTSIDVLDIRRMEIEVIPKFFRHQKFESFVRQLNLYGFRKIKVNGRHRFTHPQLLNGQELTAITALKVLKTTKMNKKEVLSVFQFENSPHQTYNKRILLNSMENAFEQQTLNERRENIIIKDNMGMQKPAGSAFFLVPPNYFSLWNYMQLLGGQTFQTMSGPFRPLQFFNNKQRTECKMK